MQYLLIEILGFSILFPAIAALVRFNRISPVYYPFILCIWLGLANELVTLVTVKLFHSNAVNSNIYVLLESFLICWQFRNWGPFSRFQWLFPTLMAIFFSAWCVENFVISHINRFSSWFRILYSFVIVLLSISVVNYQVVRERRSVLKDPATLISLVFIVYYTYRVLVEAFWVYGINENSIFRNKVYFIFVFINVLSNLVYGLAIIWMPTKHRFTLPY